MRRMGKLDDKSLTSINLEAGRLTRLVGGLLLLAQAESGKLSLDMKPLELDTLVLEVFQEMRVLAGEKVRLEAVEHRSDADVRRPRPAEAGAAERGGQCHPVHAAGRRGTDESRRTWGSRRASSFATRGRGYRRKTCRTSSNASTGRRSRARVVAAADSDWGSRSRSGSWRITTGRSRWNPMRDRGPRLPSGCRWCGITQANEPTPLLED